MSIYQLEGSELLFLIQAQIDDLTLIYLKFKQFKKKVVTSTWIHVQEVNPIAEIIISLKEMRRQSIPALR